MIEVGEGTGLREGARVGVGWRVGERPIGVIVAIKLGVSVGGGSLVQASRNIRLITAVKTSGNHRFKEPPCSIG